MKISILTLFPEMFKGPFDSSIIKRSITKGLVEINYINIRNFGIGKHKVVDDTPYGGGTGMVMRVDVIQNAISNAKCHQPTGRTNISCNERIILTSASGKKFKQQTAQLLTNYDHIIIVCGHYEGIDERIKQYTDEEISIGDFVLTGGELPAMLISDAVIRLIPGVLKKDATEKESFTYSPHGKTLLEYPQFTRPETFGGHNVPEVLLSGNHKKIEEWRQDEALNRTNENS